MDDLDYFRAGLKKVLEERGRGSATNLALDAHISDSYISQIISGKRKDPSRRTIKKICTALELTEAEIIAKGREGAQGEPKAAPDTGDQVTLRDITKIKDQLIEALSLIDKLGSEIGKIRDKMEEASQTGDIKRLGIVGGKGR